MKSRNKHKIFALIAVVVLLMTLMPMTVLATHSGSEGVNATVTPAFVSVAVSAQNIAYGTVDLGASDAQPTGQTGSGNGFAAFEVNNNGTKTSNWAIVGGASTNWTIAATPGNNIYAHFYDDAANVDGDLVAETSLHTSSSLATNVTETSSVFVWLELDMPSDSDTTATESLPVTVTATASS